MEADWLENKHELVAAIKNGHLQPASPQTLPLCDIKTCPEVFQHRSGNKWRSSAHVEELARALKNANGKPLEPITVFWVGDGWCCIDGHHRLHAYSNTGFTGVIPVRVFEGSLDDAIGEALRGNSKNKLAMDRHEKTEAAWRLVIGTELSKSRVVRASGASDGTVAHQRRVKLELSRRYPEFSLGSIRWADALMKFKGLEPDQLDRDDDWLEKEAQTLANRITKHLGPSLARNPEVTARALEIYDQPLMTFLADWLKPYEEDEDCDF